MSDPTPSQSDAPPQLDYFQRQRLAWIGRHRKKLIFIAVCIAIAVPIWGSWPSLKHRVLWIYWSRRAAAHVMPAKPIEHVIRDPQEVKRLAADDDFLTFTSPLFEAVYVPKTYRELARYESRLKLVNSSGASVAFMGLRHRPDGAARLVLIAEELGPLSQPLCFTGVLVLPEPGWFDPLPPASVKPVQMFMGIGQMKPVSLTTGVADPADSSHIVFNYTAGWGTRIVGSSGKLPNGVIDAYLQNDDSITFTPRFDRRSVRIWEPQNVIGDPDVLQKLPRNSPRVRPAATTLPAAR